MLVNTFTVTPETGALVEEFVTVPVMLPPGANAKFTVVALGTVTATAVPLTWGVQLKLGHVMPLNNWSTSPELFPVRAK